MTPLPTLALACVLGITAAAQPRVVPHVLTDPAVFTFTDFVDTRLRPPLSNAAIITGVDLFISALEAIVIARDFDDDLLDEAHVLRRQAREVYDDRATRERIADRRELFEDLAELLDALNERLPTDQRIPSPRVEAVERAADGLESAEPLVEQPHAVERFFRHAAAALRVARP